MPDKDTHVTSTSVEQIHPQQPRRLYSPTMPHLEMMLPSFNGVSSYGTLNNQVAPADSLASRISIDRANHVARDSAKPSAPHRNNTIDRPSVPTSPVRTAKSKKEEHGTAVEKSTVVSNGRSAPNGEITVQNGSGAVSNGKTAPPNGISAAPSGKTAALNGYIPASGGKTAASNGNIATLNGTNATPNRIHISTSSTQAPSSANSSLSIDKPTLPGLLPTTNQSSIESRPPISTDVVPPISTQTYQATAETTGNLQGLFEVLRSRNNGYLPSSSAPNMMSSPVPVSSNLYLNTQQHNQQYNQERPITGGARPQDSLPTYLTNGTSTHNHNMYPPQDQSQELKNAHVVRIEALLKGAMAELELLRRCM